MNLCGKSATYVPNSDCECYEMARELLLDVLSDYMTREETEEALALKQDTLVAGENITINGVTISADSITRDAILNALGYEEIEIGYTDRSGNTVIANVIGRTETETMFNIVNDLGANIVVYPVNEDESDMGSATTIYPSTTFVRFANALWDHLVGIDSNGDYIALNDTGVQFCADYGSGTCTPTVSNFNATTNTYSFISG